MTQPSTATRTRPTTAADLRPGMVVVDATGARLYAAFDVDHHGPADAPLVRIWTALRDQEAGQPAELTVPASQELLVEAPAVPALDDTHHHTTDTVVGYDVVRTEQRGARVQLQVTAVVEGGNQAGQALRMAKAHRTGASYGYTLPRYACGCREVGYTASRMGVDFTADADQPAPATDPLTEVFGEVIHTYTRAQAIEDGALVDTGATAREAGFTYPVAITAGAWAEAVAWGPADERRKPEGTGQDQSGRLWDVLFMGALAVRRAKAAGQHGDRLPFEVLRVPREGRGVSPRRCALVLHVGPGDQAEPVITIMLPEED